MKSFKDIPDSKLDFTGQEGSVGREANKIVAATGPLKLSMQHFAKKSQQKSRNKDVPPRAQDRIAKIAEANRRRAMGGKTPKDFASDRRS